MKEKKGLDDKKIKNELNDLVNNHINDEEVGSLNYLWEIRHFLDKNSELVNPSIKKFIKGLSLNQIHNYIERLNPERPEDLLRYLLALASHSYIYIRHYFYIGTVDRSLKAILHMCFNSSMSYQLEYSDPELDVLASMFNRMFKSGRKNLHCYDCGTVARGILYSLVKEYRHTFNLTAEEIYKLRDGYLYHKHGDSHTGLEELTTNLRKIDKPCVFIVGLKFGPNKFGHIFVIEKQWYRKKPVIRFYQSALNSYLLMDYLVLMGYFEDPLNGVDIDDFERDMLHLITVKRWTPLEDEIFVKWFAFYPQSEIDDTSHIRINSSYVIYGDGET